MQIKAGKILEDPRRDIYWTILTIQTDDKKKQSKVFVAASVEDLRGYAKRTVEVGISEFTALLEDVKKYWSGLGDGVFEHAVHTDCYATTAEGKFNLTKFLANKVESMI